MVSSGRQVRTATTGAASGTTKRTVSSATTPSKKQVDPTPGRERGSPSAEVVSAGGPPALLDEPHWAALDPRNHADEPLFLATAAGLGLFGPPVPDADVPPDGAG